MKSRKQFPIIVRQKKRGKHHRAAQETSRDKSLSAYVLAHTKNGPNPTIFQHNCDNGDSTHFAVLLFFRAVRDGRHLGEKPRPQFLVFDFCFSSLHFFSLSIPLFLPSCLHFSLVLPSSFFTCSSLFSSITTLATHSTNPTNKTMQQKQSRKTNTKQ